MSKDSQSMKAARDRMGEPNPSLDFLDPLPDESIETHHMVDDDPLPLHESVRRPRMIWNNSNAHLFEAELREWGASLTVPDMSMSIRDLLKRHAAGLNDTQGKVPLYDDDDADFDNFIGDLDSMDVGTRQEVLDGLTVELVAIKERILARQHSEAEIDLKPASGVAGSPASSETEPPAGSKTADDKK